MKKMKLLYFAVGFMLMGAFTSCQSNDDIVVTGLPVTINFTNTTALDSLYDNDPDTITGTVSTDAKIKSIQFYSNFFANGKEDSVEIAGSEIAKVTENPCKFSVNVPPITKLTKIRVVVTQDNGAQSSAVYTIKMLTLNIFKNNWNGGWESPNYGSFYSVSNNASYGLGIESDQPEKVKECDFYFGDYEVGAIDLDYTKFADAPQFSDMGTRFAMTDFTAAQFDAITTTDKAFRSLPDPTLEKCPFKAGDVILFKTKLGKRGLLKIVSASDTEDYNFDVKVQK